MADVPARTPLPVHRAPRAQRLSRLAFYSHLWLGVIFTVALVVIAVTGILLNHKRGLGLMPAVASAPTQSFDAALPLARLAAIAQGPVATASGITPGIDRMDVRPSKGYVKVRLRDATSTEVTVDLVTGQVLHAGARGDVFLERLHSGEVFGSRGVLISDAAAVALVLTLVTGYWLWLAPKIERRVRPASAAGDPAGTEATP